MKQSKLILLLFVEAILCLTGAIVAAVMNVGQGAIISFPYVQIAAEFRTMSLSGNLGNILACILYGGIIAVPILYFLYRCRKGRIKAEDGLLILLSILLGVVLYLLINPAYINKLRLIEGMSDIMQGCLCITLNSLLLAYIILRVLRASFYSEDHQLYRFVKVGLTLLGAYYIFSWCGIELHTMIDKVSNLAAQNTEQGGYVAFTWGFHMVSYVIKGIPIFFCLTIVLKLINLVRAIQIDRYSDAVVTVSRQISNMSRVTIIAVVLLYAVLNMAQIALGKYLFYVDTTVTIPLGLLVFNFLIMLLTKYFAGSRDMKQENDMFV